MLCEIENKLKTIISGSIQEYFVSLADYVSIVTNGKNWSSFFEEMLVRPEETRIAGGKEAKTQWILRLSAIKNKLSKESYSVPVDEYSYVKSVYDWIMEMFKNLKKIL